MSESYVEIGGDASGLIAALAEAGQGLINFAALSEAQVARINAALAGLAQGSIQQFRSALAEIGATAGVDTLVSSLAIASRGFETNIALVQQLKAEIAGLQGLSAISAGAARTAIAPPITTQRPGTDVVVAGGASAASGASLSGSTEIIGQWSRELVNVGGQVVEVFARVDQAALQMATRLSEAGAGGGSAQRAIGAGSGRPTYTANGYYETGGPSDPNRFGPTDTGSGRGYGGDYARGDARGFGGGYNYGGAAGGGGSGGGGISTAAAADAESQGQSFFAQFSKGFGGGSGKDSKGLPEQIGNIAKYTLFYGTAYKALFAFQQGLVIGVQQLEAFQLATVDLAAQMDTTTAQASALATQLGNVAAANGAAPSVGVQAGIAGIGLYGLTGQSAAVTTAAALQAAATSTQAGYISGQAVPQIQGQIAATAQGFGLTSQDQQMVSDVAAFVDRRYALTPLSSLAGTAAIAGTAQAAGFDLNQTTAMVAYLQSRTGQDSTSVSSSLAAIFAKIATPAIEQKLAGYGVDTTKAYSAQLAQLSTMVANGAISSTGVGNQLGQISTLFGGRKIADTTQLLIQGGDPNQPGGYNAVATDAAAGSAGEATKEFNRQMDTLKGELTQLHSSMLLLLKDLGASGLLNVLALLGGAVEVAVKELDIVVQLFDKIPTPVRETASALGLLATAILLLGRNAQVAAAASVASSGDVALSGAAATALKAGRNAGNDSAIYNAMTARNAARDAAATPQLTARNAAVGWGGVIARDDGLGASTLGAATGEARTAALTLGEDISRSAPGFAEGLALGVKDLSTTMLTGIKKAASFFERDVGALGIGIAAAAVGAFALSLYSAIQTMNKADASLTNVISGTAIANNATQGQSQQTAIQTAVDKVQKSRGGILGTLGRAADAEAAWFWSKPSGKGNGLGTGAQYNTVGGYTYSNANAQAGNIQAANEQQVATAQGVINQKLQDLQNQAVKAGGAGSIDFTSAATVTASLTAMDAAGYDAADKMKAVIASLNDLGTSAKGAGAGLDPLTQQKVGLGAAEAYGTLVGQAFAKGSGLGGGSNDSTPSLPVGFDLTKVEGLISGSTAQALKDNGGKLTPAQEKVLIDNLKLQIKQLVPNLDPNSPEGKALLDLINTAVNSTIVQASGSILTGGVDLAAVAVALKSALTDAPALGTMAQQNALQYQPGNATAAQAASLQAQTQSLQAARADAAKKLNQASSYAAANLGDSGATAAVQTALLSLSQIDDQLQVLSNDTYTNVVAMFQAAATTKISLMAAGDVMGKLAAQTQADAQALALNPFDPTAINKVAADAIAQGVQGQADQTSKNLAAVKPGDTIGAAAAAVKNAQIEIDAAGPLTGSNIAAYNKAQLDMATALQGQSLAYVTLAGAQASAHIDPTDQLEQANAQIVNLTAKIKAEGATTLAGIQDQATLNQTLITAANAAAAQAGVARSLGGDTTNPVFVAQQALVSAQQAQGIVDANPLSSVASKQAAALATRTASDASFQAAFTKSLSDTQTMAQLGQINNQAYLGYLEQEHGFLQHKIAGMTAQTDGYVQAKNDLNTIDAAILAAATAANAQFNLAGIKIPTPYEVRRYIAGDQTGATGAGASSVTINFSGSDITKVQQVLGQYLGPNVIDSYSTITRKVA